MSASLLSNLPSCSTAASIQPKGCRLPTSRRLGVDSSTELHPDFGLIEHRRWCSPGTSPGAWGPPLGNASAAIPGGAWGKRSPSVSAPAAGAAASAQHPPAGDGKNPQGIALSYRGEIPKRFYAGNSTRDPVVRNSKTAAELLHQQRLPSGEVEGVLCCDECESL